MDSILGEQLSARHKEAPLRIAHLLSSGGFYGLERMLLEHCQYAPGQHRVFLLKGPEPLAQRFREAGVELTRCTGLGSLLRQLGQPNERPALLNGHGFKGLVYGWLSALFLGLPLVVTQHGFTPRSRKQHFYTWLSLRLCRTRKVRAVVCVADSIARLHRQAGVRAGKVHVLPNGLPPAPAVTYLRPPAAPPAPLIGFVGRLSAEKGPDLFVELAIELCRHDPRLHAVLLGEGPLHEELKQSIDDAGLQERILLPGYRKDLPAWLRALNVLIISSRSEGTPMVLLEAMQAGVPVAAFAVGGIPNVLEHEVSGLLSPPGEVGDLAMQVARLLFDKALCRALTEQARLAQLRHYHLPAQAERWRQLYRNAVGG